ncbi:MAG: TonB-dependent receptor [Gemmatimonadaceae bacterium]|nr:TonB-dependent receptor [Gemmatimonadaceae bacterium]
MRTSSFVVLLSCGTALASSAVAQAPIPPLIVSGHVTSGGRAVVGATIERLGGTPTIVARSDTAGHFRARIVAEGIATLRFRAIGHTPVVRRLDAGRRDTLSLNVELTASASVLNTVVTTATAQERYVSDAAVKVDVITPAFLQRNVSNNLMDNVSFLNGLNQQVDCGVCFTNNIRINGMEGPYTAVLIDGTPLVSALATVYGLNGIDPSLIEQLEIMKGPGSTLYGSEAMGGVINIVTKDPRLAPRLSINAFGSSDGETSLSIGATPSVGSARTLLSVNGAYNTHFVDRNADGFSDLPLVKRISVLNKWSLGTPARQPLTVTARLYAEDRFGGVRAWREADRGSSDVYGESIRTRRGELLGTWRADPSAIPLRVDVSASWHDQNSFYGAQPYMATQAVAFSQGAWSPVIGRHSLLIGGTLKHQTYRDSTAAQTTRESRTTPGIFAQDDMLFGTRTTVLAGLRLDRHEVHGVIPSPRLAVRWLADEHTTVRVNGATGFRVVNLFTEDHAALTGARAVRIAERLEPERSASVTVGVNRVLDVQGIEDAMTIDVDAFVTRFTNRIVGDFDTDPALIVYRNLDGIAVTRGASIALGYATLRKPLFANAGVTVQDVYIRERGRRRAVPFAPTVQVVFSLGYRVDPIGMTVDWTGRVQGPSALPRFDGLPDRSPWLTEQHVQFTKRVRRGAEVYAAVKNVFDYVQRNAIIDPFNPFGDAFATERVYGPLQGRRVVLGVRHAVGR